MNVLNKLERKTGRVKFSKIFKSITVDNGSEFLNDKGMEKSLFSKNLTKTNIYYAHPYCSWERGSNEQTNGMIRRFIPKGSLITAVKVKEVKDIERWLNNYPRRLFDGESSYEFKKRIVKSDIV
ncbi:MAG: IS30 family transposase [Tissierella sp.]|uniref:IS30 family transposase n=1 Tax=Tissierella sp. TaxID=41274 RepID=UPI003F9B681F